jgi:hypothetical protein
VLDFGAVSLEWGTLLTQVLVFLPMLLLYGLAIYLIVKAIHFMKTKIRLDREYNEKLAQLSEHLRK